MLNSVDAIIDALGGNKPTAELAKVGETAVSNWRTFGKIPARYLLKFEQELGELPPDCFGFKR